MSEQILTTTSEAAATAPSAAAPNAAPEAPAASAPPSAARSSSGPSVPAKSGKGIANLVSAIAIASCVGTIGYMFLPGAIGTTSHPMVVIDTQAIVESRVAAMQQKDVDATTMARDSQEFAKKLKDIVSSYSKHSVVANRQFVMAWPDGADITHEVAKKLDVDLSLKMQRNPNGGIPENFDPSNSK